MVVEQLLLIFFQGTAGRENFSNQVYTFKQYRSIDETLAAAFHSRLEQQIEDDKAKGKTDLHTRFEELCDRFHHFRERVS